MRLKRLFSVPFSFFLILWTVVGSSSPELQKMEGELQELENMKRGYEARALRLENQVEYLQFDQQTGLEVRRLLQLAAENRNKAALVQEQIDRLKLKMEPLQK